MKFINEPFSSTPLPKYAKLAPQYTNSTVLFVKWMHGDADLYTTTPVVFKDIELINGTESNYEMVSVYQYLYEKVEELYQDAGGYQKDMLWDSIDLSYVKKLSKAKDIEDDESLLKWFANYAFDFLGWEWDYTSDSNYRASFQGFDTYYFDENGTRYTFTEEYTSKFK